MNLLKLEIFCLYNECQISIEANPYYESTHGILLSIYKDDKRWKRLITREEIDGIPLSIFFKEALLRGFMEVGMNISQEQIDFVED